MRDGSAASDSGARRDAATMDAGTRRALGSTFWELVQVCGEPVEQFATIAHMAERADAVVVGRLVAVAVGNTVQEPGVPENFYAEANVTVEVDEVLRHDIRDRFKLSLVLPGVASADDLDRAIATLQATLPEQPMVLLVRERDDFASVYRLLNDKGLWARTPRDALDDPIADQCHDSEAERAKFVEGARSLEELIEQLRD